MDQKSLITKLLHAANAISKANTEERASYIFLDEEHIETLSEEMGITKEELISKIKQEL